MPIKDFILCPDSDILPFYCTNNILPDNLAPLLDSHLQHLEDEISQDAKNIADLRASLLEKEQNQERLVSERRTWHSIGKGVRTLPVELLSKIFAIAVTFDSGGRPTQAADPMYLNGLRRVCKPWDSVAVGTPELWSSLVLDLDRTNCQGGWGVAMEHLACVWYARAGKRPLKLVIIACKAYEHDSNDQWTPLVTALSAIFTQPSSNNIDRLSIDYKIGRLSVPHGLDLLQSLDTVPRERFINVLFKLEELSLTDWWCHGLLTHKHLSSRKTNTLKSLYVSNSLSDNSIELSGAYLPNSIRSLHIDGAHQFRLTVLSQLPLLEELIIAVPLTFLVIAEGKTPVVAPSLRRLIVGHESPLRLFKAFLNSVTTPSLQLLRIGQVPNRTRSDAERIVRGPNGIILSLEQHHICSFREVEWLILKFGLELGKKIKIHVHDFFTFCGMDQRAVSVLANSVDTIVCRKTSARRDDFGKLAHALPDSATKVVVYFRDRQGRVPEIEEKMDVRYLPARDIERLFEHEIVRGHEYHRCIAQ
ncbi:hypothetical protein BKA70DRAFT_1439137 [Coprinopsis sp. MPI-PUGE-AT-0042]|nr:hypothetical protein BKA70DRAFT_1439137 [Coprinopsis sp. MPI-PUGE-AT-0042]